jgi:hypothetical protein
MTHIDRIEGKAWFLAPFFSGARKSGLFEAVIISLGGLALSVFLIAAHYIPLDGQLLAGP